MNALSQYSKKIGRAFLTVQYRNNCWIDSSLPPHNPIYQKQMVTFEDIKEKLGIYILKRISQFEVTGAPCT